MEPTHNAEEEWSHKSPKTWMVEYTVEVDEESHRHLSLIRADDVTDVHHQLLQELRKAYQTSSKVDVTVHRIEPVTTNTDTLYFEGMYAP
jgi:Fe2+ or Zn2+ uptake regulation protein|tara:strand:+ start:2065 stop:2334 length:270 start_codon:yes stop_codon:yes gene_type:complete